MRWLAAARCCYLVLLVVGVAGDNCRIRWIESGHQVQESKFQLKLSVVDTVGDETTYFPDTKYDITITSKTKEKFTKFYFTIFNENATKNYGFLELRDIELSMFHNGPYCYNRIIDGPISLAKTELKIGWHSPSASSGCITFKVAVRETDERFHVANKTVCQDPRVELDDPGVINRNCCACNEGKYELAFEGLWSRYYHPKHFPRREWFATFPTVIGASHSINYELWRLHTNASEGLKRFAEYGYTKAFEREIKANASYIRTLLKFQGANFQNVSGRSYAMLRVNKNQHLVSLVARIDPSPDWFVGVQSLELCKEDCTWIPRKTLNLYAFDVGVRDGLLYEPPPNALPEMLTDPPDVITSLNMSWPLPRLEDGLEGPFYDKTNNTHDVRPLARIHLRRIGGSDAKCEKDEVTENEDCARAWSSWSECSVECGKGIQKRNRTKRPDYPICGVKMNDTRICIGKSRKCEEPVTAEDCKLTEWGPWKKCEKSCGQEATERHRDYMWPDKKKKCHDFAPQLLKEIIDCGNPPCPEDEPLCHEEKYLSWSNYSACTEVKDVQGEKWYIKYRYRQLNKQYVQKPGEMSLNANTDGGYHGCLYEEISCEPLTIDGLDFPPEQPEIPKPVGPVEPYEPYNPVETDYDDNSNAKEPEVTTKRDLCYLPMDGGKCLDGHKSVSNRYYYDHHQDLCLPFEYSGCGGNENMFNDEKACSDTCITRGPPTDCVMEERYSDWSECRYCDQLQIRTRKIKVYPQNGGRPCPLSRKQYRSCSEIKPGCKVKKENNNETTTIKAN